VSFVETHQYIWNCWGRLHGACAKVCFLLEVETYLSLALKNKEWVGRCKNDATCAKTFFEHLH
jgi:hypothetical protein